MAKAQHNGFSNSFGVVMAAAGSAVGLGNIWRFPYICGQYGGGAFLLVYLIFVFFIGMTLLMCEFSIGRRTRRAPVKAYPALRGGGNGWKLIGVVGIVTCFMILSIYLVISGWTLNYFWESLTGSLFGDSGGFDTHFTGFAADSMRPVIFMLIFLLLGLVVILCGVKNGIESISKLLMPLLLVLVLVLCVRSLTLPGAIKGLDYLFHPDFGKLGPQGVLAALGQSLFSLSVGMGTMVVYGSYIPEKDNILKSCVWITVCDVAIAVLAGIAIFPAVFSCGLEPDKGAGLVYVVLPEVFHSFGFGTRLFAMLFFLLLSLAALTSAISLHETLTAFLCDCGMKRVPAAVLVAVLEGALAAAVAITFTGETPETAADRTFFDWMDYLTATVLPPVCALLTVLFFGWFMKKEDIVDELSNHGKLKIGWFGVYYKVLVRWVAPVALLLVLILGMMGYIK
ncbi:MAG: sodium-dependent transporter [Bacteroidales bacterium]|nr:sodium-dependent transporter [Bacteroidales bacterium]